ncbi:hypothetical protein MOQ72_17435 [Saccharopolyspora sp. K220]|uniref:hypothetical protein n=1 Tax=Saccharopolyspora soli TaxID=2926618 RepID=UPI001F55E518|nr:hypothetical protein [Saccharopolyspora soli]MCI2419232.1 hypothetical protein [Saccharopolyspora soli]
MQDIDHAEFRGLVNAYSTGALSDVEWLMMHTHLSECGSCRSELGRPELWNRAAPQWISPPEPTSWHTGPAWKPTRPGWSVVLGFALVVALVAFSVGYALGDYA